MIPIWGTSTGLNPTLDLDFVGATSLDSRITFTRGSTATFFDSTGTLQTAAVNAARFDTNPSTLAPLGLLIEEQRTNSIRNNTMQGAVAGTPGTLPTNWAVSTLSGITVSVSSIATENGITYVDLNYSGTAASTGTLFVAFDTTSGIAALDAQTWTHATYVKQTTAVSLPTTKLGWRTYTSGGALVTANNVTLTVAGSGSSLSTTRQTYSAALSGATIAFVRPTLEIDFAGSTAYNFTLRIGLPQLEQGAFATSVIPTTTTALTRNADVASMTGTNFSSWFNSSEGTLLAQGILVGGTSGTFPRQAALVGSNPDSDSIGVYWLAPSGNMAGNVRTAGVSELDQSVLPAKTAGSAFKAAVAYRTNDANVASDGNVGTTDTTVTLPTVQSLRIGGQAVFQPTASSWFRRISYYARRLPDSTLQALTA